MTDRTLFNRLLTSMILKDEAAYNAAVATAARTGITPANFQKIMENIELWCRMRGLLPLKLHEHYALIKLQSFFRSQYVKKKMLEKYNLYYRLSMTDSEDYAYLAHKYHKVLKL